jgi:hypothetical protein
MKWFSLLFFTFFLNLYAYCQTNIAGKVVNEHEEEIGFAHIYNKTNGMGKVGDINGKFDLIASKGDTVQFSFVGYQKHTIVIAPAHLDSYLKVILPEDSVVLPSITIYADSQLKVPLNFEYEPITLAGVSVEMKESKYKPGKIVAGGAPGAGGIPSAGATLEGPLTYFSRDEREKRKAAEVKENDRETITYSKFIAQDSIKQKLMTLYDIDSSQYNRVVTRLNLQYPGIQRATTPEEVWHWVINFFNDQVPVIKVFDMH